MTAFGTFSPAAEARMILGKVSDALAEEIESNESEDVVQTETGGSFEIDVLDSHWAHKRFRVSVEAI